MNKTRILHTITRMIYGGASENTMLTAEFLDKNKYEIQIFTGKQTENYGDLSIECKSKGITLYSSSFLVREISPIKDLIHFFEMISFLRKNPFDIVHTHSSKAGILHRIAAKLSGVPVIIHTIHGWSFHDQMSLVTRKFYIILERLCAKFTTRLITVNSYDIEKGLIEKIGDNNKYCLIHSAMELEKYKSPSKTPSSIKKALGIPEQSKVIGTVSRMTDQKAPMNFMKVAKSICNEYLDIYFLFVGDGHLRHQIEEYVNRHNLQTRIILPGLRRDIPDLLSIIDIFLLTSLWEGLPRVFPQAIVAGIPIIATNINGAPEIIKDGYNGFLLEPENLEGMVNAIKQLIEKPEMRKQFVERSQKIIKDKFDIHNMITQLDALYSSLTRT